MKIDLVLLFTISYKKSMKETKLLELLRKRAKNAKTQVELAKELGVTSGFLSDVLSGKKSIGVLIPKKLGYEIDYKKVKVCSNK